MVESAAVFASKLCSYKEAFCSHDLNASIAAVSGRDCKRVSQ
jgi:hypothetical protein